MKRMTMASTLAIALTISAVSVVAMPAFATPSSYDTFDGTTAATSSPTDAIVGVGSDTTEIATHGLSQAWNASNSPKLSSFAATGASNVVGDPIFLRTNSASSITRPNGSGAGKNLLHGATNNPEIDFARSSSSLSTTESSDGLKQFAFAVDGLKMAVANTTNAPASLTPAQVVDIYKGLITNWNQVGGTAGTIKPLIPQSGSGTRNFFQGRLDATNGGAVTLSGSVVTTQEHSVVDIQGDPNAIAPFSTARAKSNTATIKLLSGTEWKRAVYHVVRGGDVNDSDITAIFGKTGFVCSDAGRVAIKAAGFDPIAAYSQAGPCGVATSSAVTDLRTYDDAAAIGTSTTLAGTSTGPAVKLTATVTGNNTAGTVTFKEGDTTVGGPVDVVAGTAVLDLANVTLGSHTYSAQFTPEDPILAGPSISPDTTVVVKKLATVTLQMTPYSTSQYYGRLATATATVTVEGAPATGTVRFFRGVTSLGTVTLSNGVAARTLSAITPVGTYTITADYLGSSDTDPASAGRSFTFLRASSTTAAHLYASTIHATQNAQVISQAKITGAVSGVYPLGSVRVSLGSKVLATKTLSKGKATVVLPRLRVGKYTLREAYTGSANVKASYSAYFTLTVVR
jgi:ABC-type phosphate transport system substrate-binding protein